MNFYKTVASLAALSLVTACAQQPNQIEASYVSPEIYSGLNCNGLMKERNEGRIIFISSECGLRPLPHMLPYGVSKTSQIALSRGLAEMTKGTAVTVNSVLPGPTMTGGVRKYMEEFAEMKNIATQMARI